MPNHRADLEYDGTDFHGWQVQPGKRTVQGELVRALAVLCREEVRVVGAGRTDSGVHALGQVANFRIESAPELARLRRGLDGLLPPDMRVRRLQVAPDDFSARASAEWRSYRYQMLLEPSPVLRRFYHVVPSGLEPEAMQEAVRGLLGLHDFTAFARSGHAGETALCNVSEARLTPVGERLFFEITANRFLHNMVRRLAGALVEVGRGRRPPAALAEALKSGDRSQGGPCLPACGLFLVSVRYPGEASIPAARVVDSGPGSP